MSKESLDSPESADGPREPTRETVVLLAVLVEGGLLFLAGLLGWVFDYPPLRGLSWNALDALRGVAVAVPMVAVFLVIQAWPVGPLRRLQRFAEDVMRPLLAPCTDLDLVGISALAGFGEELLFRGVMLGVLETWMGWWGALALTSILFGLLHAVTLTYALLATLAGFYLGLVCQWSATPNLLIAVVAHALYDLIALFWLLRGPGSPKSTAEPQEASTQKGGEP
jgi:membrane protease YdiL (CAAX protease family)